MNTTAADPSFRAIADLVRDHAAARPHQPALVQGDECIDYGALDALMDRVAAALQRDGVRQGDSIAICAHSAPRYAAVFLGALRAGVAVAPLAPSVTAEQFASMLVDAQARLLFADAAARRRCCKASSLRTIALERHAARHARSTTGWPPPARSPRRWRCSPNGPSTSSILAAPPARPRASCSRTACAGRTCMRGAGYGYGPRTVTLLSTPLYSNTTLVVFFPSHRLRRHGAPDGQVRRRRLPARWPRRCASRTPCWCRCSTSASWRCRDFDRHDLTSFHMKFCTSAPFTAALKADVLKRWPGGLVEFYGMTEGGGSCILNAHEHPRQAAHRGPPGRRPRHPPDRRAGPRGAARRGRRGGGPFGAA